MQICEWLKGEKRRKQPRIGHYVSETDIARLASDKCCLVAPRHEARRTGGDGGGGVKGLRLSFPTRIDINFGT